VAADASGRYRAFIMIPRERSFWVAQALVLYVCAAHLRTDPVALRGWFALVLGPCVLFLGTWWAERPALGADWIDPKARRAVKLVVFGAALELVAELAPSTPGFVTLRVVGLGLATTFSPVAVAHISSLGGAARTIEPRHDAAFVTALLWVFAFGLAVWRAFAGDAAVDALAVDYAVVAAALGSMGIGMVASWRAFAARRFELGVPERAAASLWLGLVCLALGTLASLMEAAPPERIVPFAALVAALVSAACALSQQPAEVARFLRLSAAATMLASPVMSIAVLVAYKAPTHAGVIVFASTAAAVAVGIVAPRAAERMAPDQGKWLRVFERAIRAAKAPDPRQAVTLALVAVRDGLGADEGPAALYRFASADRWLVDRAGYLHVEESAVPLALIERLTSEPERVVSVEMLRALEVRQSEARPFVAWLDAQRAGAAALVLDDEVPVGMLLWPAAGRVTPLACDEVKALRTLADHLGVATGAEARLDRARARGLEVEQGMRDAADEIRALQERIDREAGRLRASAAFLAERVRVAAYGPAVQMALTLAERLGQRNEPVSVTQRSGGDALPWAALMHLASRRAESVMLVIDCTRREEHILERWTDTTRSPLDLARGGSLVLLDAQALPRHVQRAIGTSRRVDSAIFALLPKSPAEMLWSGAIDEHFAALFEDRVLVPPTLSERAEDLRALALHELARIGSRLRGKAFGISLEAQKLLGEHPWPGNEVEFADTLLRAALATDGDVVGRDAVAAALSEHSERAAVPKTREPSAGVEA
jgi:hypothetical protein